MSKLLNARGCFYTVERAGNAPPSRGMYSLSPSMSPTTRNSPVLINNVAFGKNDIVLPKPCLDNLRVFYTFGKGFGSITVSGEILLGPVGSMNAGEALLNDYIDKYRVAQINDFIQVSSLSGGVSYPFYLVNGGATGLDPQLHILNFQLQGVLLEVR